MAQQKKTPKVPVREGNPHDGIRLLGIVSGIGGGERIAEAVSIALEAHQQKQDNVTLRAAAVAISDGLHAALRDPAVLEDAEKFLYGVWAPKFTLGEGESYEDRKEKEWEKSGMVLILEIMDAFRQTRSFSDFLAFFTSRIPTRTASGDTSTQSNENTA